MVRFVDGSKELEMTCDMYVGGYWADCTEEVFAADMVNYDRVVEAYVVEDVNAIIEFAKGWKE